MFNSIQFSDEKKDKEKFYLCFHKTDTHMY